MNINGWKWKSDGNKQYYKYFDFKLKKAIKIRLNYTYNSKCIYLTVIFKFVYLKSECKPCTFLDTEKIKYGDPDLHVPGKNRLVLFLYWTCSSSKMLCQINCLWVVCKCHVLYMSWIYKISLFSSNIVFISLSYNGRTKHICTFYF